MFFSSIDVLFKKGYLTHMPKTVEETMTLDELKENFSFFDGWEEKYAYLIDLGKNIEPLDDIYKVNAYKIDGCTSNVWLVANDDDGIITFKADSDAMIVRGLIKILLCAYNDKTKEGISKTDINKFFADIGLDKHLSPNRRNGFFSMVEKIKSI